MAPEFEAVVQNALLWLQSSWHIQAPFAWLEACVEWLQEEAGGAGRLSQQQINQQVDSDMTHLRRLPCSDKSVYGVILQQNLMHSLL